jgi:hypothetical protein
MTIGAWWWGLVSSVVDEAVADGLTDGVVLADELAEEELADVVVPDPPHAVRVRRRAAVVRMEAVCFVMVYSFLRIRIPAMLPTMPQRAARIPRRRSGVLILPPDPEVAVGVADGEGAVLDAVGTADWLFEGSTTVKVMMPSMGWPSEETALQRRVPGPAGRSAVAAPRSWSSRMIGVRLTRLPLASSRTSSAPKV